MEKFNSILHGQNTTYINACIYFENRTFFTPIDKEKMLSWVLSRRLLQIKH